MTKTQYFSPEKVAEIRDRYGFSLSFPLADELEDAARLYMSGKADARKKPVSEQRKVLEKIRDDASKLSATLAALDEPELARFLPTPPDQAPSPADKYQSQFLQSMEFVDLSQTLQKLSKRADMALSEMESQPRKPANLALARLIKVLRDVYINGTGKRDRQSSGDEVKGSFVRLVHEIATYLGYSGGEKTIANQVSRYASVTDDALIKHGRVSPPE